MKVFVAGATGAMGKQLVPALVGAGHQVVAMTRSADKTAALAAAGAEPVVADGLDRAAVLEAVTRTAPVSGGASASAGLPGPPLRFPAPHPPRSARWPGNCPAARHP